MKEKITLKVVRELTKEYCHLVVPVKLLIPEEILYDVVRVYQYGIMTFNTSKVFEDEIVDSAVFCMSLWGTNYLDSIKEAHRYLKTGGTLYVVEPKDKVDQSVLLGEVVQLGFNLTNLVLERNGKTYFEYKKIR